MRFLRPLTVGAILVLAQLYAFGAQIAVLRNGFSIRFDHKELIGNSTRLYTTAGYLDIASDQITSFEEDETPVVPEPQTTAQPAAQPLAATSKTAAPATAVQNIDLDQVVREASSRNRLDPDFVSSVIRAESNFKPHAVSKKGALGLMQLMPATAARVAHTLKIIFKRKDALTNALTTDPGLNIKLGTAYLNGLLSDFGGSYILAAAGYNAGPARAQEWIRTFGDPRDPSKTDPVDWIEQIPFA
ncbi:MAG: lytic transglycosylase domain-containing protein, partial [Candidatus Angelobacter sp.]